MQPGNILSIGFQVEAYCPPGSGAIPGVPEKAYQLPVRTNTFGLRIIHRFGSALIWLGERLAAAGQPNERWVEDMT